MIKNAKDSLISDSFGSLPQMDGALHGWFQKITIKLLSKSVADFELEEKEEELEFRGVVQPVSPQVVERKPEGQRNWRWIQIHSETSLPVKVDDVIIHKGVKYRVEQRSNYSEYGYYWYQLMEDYTDGN